MTVKSHICSIIFQAIFPKQEMRTRTHARTRFPFQRRQPLHPRAISGHVKPSLFPAPRVRPTAATRSLKETVPTDRQFARRHVDAKRRAGEVGA